MKVFQSGRSGEQGNAGIAHNTTHPICTSSMLGKAANQQGTLASIETSE